MTAANKLKGQLVCAVDLGGTHLRVATVDVSGEIKYRLKQSTPVTDDPLKIVSAIVMAAEKCHEQSKAEGQSIGAISVVVPGTVNIADGTVTRIPNVPSLNSFALSAVLADALGWRVFLENDANAAAVGEMWRGAARGRRTIVCLTLGTGVGSGIILDGNLWHGASDSAGEIGHTSIEPFNGPACSCGSRGCLEVYTSATAIVRMANEGRSRHPSSILNATDELTAKTVFAAGKNGDAFALEVFQRMGDYLGVGLANIINILNPEMIVIGGGVVNGWELFEKQMHRRIHDYAFRLPAANVKIVPAECGDDAGLLGAARLAFLSQVP